MITLRNSEEAKRLDAILHQASQLPLERQEYLLEAIKGMVFVHEQLQAEKEPPDPVKPPHS